MGNARRPGGGVDAGVGAQEDNLHRRSDACRYLEGQRYVYYPIQHGTCLLSRGVTVFRGAEADGYPFIRPFRVDVITCAAPARPPLDAHHRYSNTEDEEAMRTQVEVILEAARLSGCEALVLSAFGCGAFGHPPDIVAELFRTAIRERGGSRPYASVAAHLS